MVATSQPERIMAHTLAEGLGISQQNNADMSAALYILASHRVAADMALRAIFRN